MVQSKQELINFHLSKGNGWKKENKKKKIQWKTPISMKCVSKICLRLLKWARESTTLLLANRPNFRETFLHWYKNREEAKWKTEVNRNSSVCKNDDLSIEWMNVILGVGKCVSKFIDTFTWKKFRKWLTDCGGDNFGITNQQ